MLKTSKRKAVSNAKEEDEGKETRTPKKLKVERKEVKEEPPEEEIMEDDAPVEFVKGVQSRFLWQRAPDIFKELWQKDNPGVDLKSITYGSQKKYKWRCSRHNTCDDHVWETTVCQRTRSRGSGCPFCSTGGTARKYCKCNPAFNFLWQRNPAIFKELWQKDNPGVDLKKITFGSQIKYKWRCSLHDTCDEHVWEARVFCRTKVNGSGCPFCSEGNLKKDCKCTWPSFLNRDGSHKPGYKEKMKRCSRKECKKEKPISEFYSNKTTKDQLSSYCKECADVISKEYADLRSVMRRLFFQGKSCKDCGETNDTLFECDHVFDDKARTKDDSKSVDIIQLSTSKLCLELKKTEILCVFCHRKRTNARSKIVLSKYSKPIKLNHKFVKNLKLKREKCATCNTVATELTYRSFDFDHLDSQTKNKCISKMVYDGSTHEEIKAEAELCQLLCCNCHRIKTAESMKWRKLSDFPEHIIKKARLILDKFFDKDSKGNYIHVDPKKPAVQRKKKPLKK